MIQSTTAFFGKCSFLTQMFFVGWQDGNTPMWGKLLRYDQNKWPVWNDWDGTKNNFIAPLCNVAKSVALFGNEWSNERQEVIDLRKFADVHFHKKGRYLVCDQPRELIDAELFWTGGSADFFCLIKVFCFEIQHLEFVLECLRYHQQAGTMGPRYGGEYTRINTYAKSIAKKGGFSIIFDGTEAEMFFPIEYNDQVFRVANEIEERRLKEAKIVASRIRAAQR